MITVAIAAGAVVAIEQRRVGLHLIGPGAVLASLAIAGAIWPAVADGAPVRVAIVQGSTPCPFIHCADERIVTEGLHLTLTRGIEPGSVDLVVWSESSAVGFRTNPQHVLVDSPIATEAVRLAAFLIAGSDVAVSDTEWINVVGAVGPDGRSVGEYLKQHPVPFGEYIPLRSLFGWAETLGAASRDMIPGQGPVVFDLGLGRLGVVISFEGGFARYPRAQAIAGAQLLAVATNEGGYGHSPASDQLIGMTRMRAAELGMDVIHAAVTGRSTLITDGGQVGHTTELAESTVLIGNVRLRTAGPTLYTRWGDWVQVMAIGFLLGWLGRSSVRREPKAIVGP
jgi:apolipoprotein N-acyltransferase